MSPDAGCRELTVAHGSVSHTDTGFGARAKVLCDDCFYRSDGDDLVVCNEDGRWSAYPKCLSECVKSVLIMHHHVRLPSQELLAPNFFHQGMGA